MERLEILKTLVEQNPRDVFAHYGLAMEFTKAGNFDDAVREYRALIGLNPDYVAAYYHGGQALEKLAKFDEARLMYRSGIEATNRTNDAHARSELEAALDLIGGM
jgi:tetratricopeptide (TPR) repeat protein